MKILIKNAEIQAAKHSSRNSRKSSSKKITDHMIRARSSNVWSYAFDIDADSDIGTMYIQYKNARGGPGDIYRYYNVPAKIYRRFVAAPSKGHSVWKFLRDKYQYSKLTGDKRGKLRNAVNN